MNRATIITSLCTGIFCAIFAGAVDYITDALAMWHVMAFGAASGFCGSFFGQKVARRL